MHPQMSDLFAVAEVLAKMYRCTVAAVASLPICRAVTLMHMSSNPVV